MNFHGNLARSQFYRKYLQFDYSSSWYRGGIDHRQASFAILSALMLPFEKVCHADKIIIEMQCKEHCAKERLMNTKIKGISYLDYNGVIIVLNFVTYFYPWKYIILTMCFCSHTGTSTRPRPWNTPDPSHSQQQAKSKYTKLELESHIAARKFSQIIITYVPFLLPQGGDVCCVNVGILNYYLNHILHAVQGHYPRLQLVKPDLHRVARDLEPHCVSIND